jgi:fructose-1,6-bisphosphatase-3
MKINCSERGIAMETYTQEFFDEASLNHSRLLAKQYPTIDLAAKEIINLQAILNLPKGTEHFLSDVHGESEAFNHMLKNASGVIKRKIDDIFGTSLRDSAKKSLATLIYYPERKLELIKETETNLDDWYKINLYRLIQVCKLISSKYTRSKVRKALPKEFSYILEELIHEDADRLHKQDYYNNIIETIIKLDRADAFITAISKLIQRLSIDRLHIIGDIFDKGPGAAAILDTLMAYHSVDIQWGNHDMLWMGAAAGSEACICNVLRISSRYFNFRTIEESYGINLLPLATFAMEFYSKENCEQFIPAASSNQKFIEKELALAAIMHKAISILQFKLEGQLIKRHKELKMEDRLLLEKIDYKKGTINLNGKEYLLNDTSFPTINPEEPYELIPEEKDLIEKLKSSFLNSEKLQKHVSFLFSKGSIYLKFNSNLLYHGCIPMNEDGSFRKIMIEGKEYWGKRYLDKVERMVREGCNSSIDSEAKQAGLDLIWYLWCGPYSPLFGKKNITTFERYFINEKETHVEENDPYFRLRNHKEICVNIFREFGLDPSVAHIINGHIPVKAEKGESPIKANGKLLVIDGDFTEEYQKRTGIAGHTLIYSSHGLKLASHKPFSSASKAIEEEIDILPFTIELEHTDADITVGDTDIGHELEMQISDLKRLLTAFRKGLIKEEKNN